MRFVPIIVVLTLAGTAYCQTTTYSTSPPGYLTTEAGEFVRRINNAFRMCRYFGAYSEYETQIIDDHVRGRGLKLISQIDFRSDGSFGHGRNGWHSATRSMGRTWTSVSLSMSEGSLSGPLSKTWTLNYSRTPTKVFSGSMTWPTVTGNTYARWTPNDWGVVSFPFSTVFAATGSKAVLQHYKFSGGTLANSGTWTGTTSAQYLLDSHYNDNANTGYYYVNNSANNACVDSFHGGNRFGYAYVYATAYASNPAIAGPRAGKIWMDMRTHRTAPLSPVFWAISLGTANLALGVTCKNNAGNTITPPLSVDLSTGLLLAKTARYDGTTSAPVSVNYFAAAAGVRLYVQGAWADSATSSLSVTRRAMTQIGDQPPGKMLCLYRNGSSTSSTFAIATGQMQRIPLTRYKH